MQFWKPPFARTFLLYLCLVLLSLSVQAQFTMTPATFAGNGAVSLGNNCWRLNDTLVNTERGVIWSTQRINLNEGFDFTFYVSVMSESTPFFAADGMAFVLQDQGLAATSAIGGNTNGYLNQTPNPPTNCPPGFNNGINPSFAVELDVFDNSGACVNDIAVDHMAVHIDGDYANPVFGPTALPGNQDVATNVGTRLCREFRIRYDAATSRITAFYNGTPVINNQFYNIQNNVFGGDSLVHFGITAANGGLTSEKIVCFEFADAGPDTAICAGDPLILNGSGGTTFSWAPSPLVSNSSSATPSFVQPAFPAPPFTYPLELTVTNFLGCTDVDTVFINVNQSPVAEGGPNQSICLGDPAIGIGQAGTAGIVYSWTPATGLSSTSVANPTASPGVTTTYFITATDTSTNANCSTVDSVIVTVNTPPVAFAGADRDICPGACAGIGSPSQPGLTYSWTPAAGLSSATAADPQACPGATTSYILTVTDPLTTCSSMDTVVVTVLPAPVATILSATPDSICPGLTSQLLADSSGGDQIAWSPAGSLTATNILNPVASPTSSTWYYFTVTNSGTGCSTTDSVQIIVNPSDSLSILTPDDTLCAGDTLGLNVFADPGIDGFSWTPSLGLSDPNISNPSAFPDSSTTYVLTGSNSSNGCQAIDSVRISVFYLEVSGPADTIVCRGDSFQLDVTVTGSLGGYAYNWSGPDLSANDVEDPLIVALTGGFYVLQVTDTLSGCTGVFSFNLGVSDLTVTVDPVFQETNPGQRVQVNASTPASPVTWTWTPDQFINCTTCPDPVVFPETEGSTVYTVTATDTNGCLGMATVTILVDSFIVPNVFTPNGDGVNDELELNYFGQQVYQVQVYDRWGRLLWETTDPRGLWNGKDSNGNDVPEGVYYMLVRIHADDVIPGEDKNHIFHVTLLR